MFLPWFPCSARLILLLSILLGLGLPILSAQAFQLPHFNQLSLPTNVSPHNFDPPGDPVPKGTRGAGSRGIVYKPSFPKL
ncbi:MAG: hypothetical protein KME11_18005 [Timaviella obliquedivisa GSE-PSE-MK23-08B]|nr:hypothetical protein [Timaviella obliquedivisa GSE-PSE-MK23-08B]